MEWCPEIVAERIAYLRNRKGVSALQMSRALSQSDSYINKVENHEIVPPFPSFFAICKYLNIEPSDFFDLKQRFPEKLIPLIADLECLDEEELNHIAAIVKSMKK